MTAADEAGADEPAADGGAGAPLACDAVVDLRDALAVVRFGAQCVDTGIDDRLASAMAPADAESLVAALDALRRALQAGDPRARRRPGLIARLTGRDVLVEAEDAGLRDRIGVLLLDADRSAGALAARASSQEALHAELGDAMRALARRVTTARAWLALHPEAGVTFALGGTSPRTSFERRLQQLETVHSAWGIAHAQLALLRDQALDLLARHRRIRDVLLPAWRQQALAEAAGDGALRRQRAAAAHAAIATEVAAMTAKLARADRGPTPHGDGP